jgi:uncharacterized surface protein with fasciclin (FAS1) repeats
MVHLPFFAFLLVLGLTDSAPHSSARALPRAVTDKPVSITQTLAKMPANSVFYRALVSTKYEMMLDAPGEYTVFAPTDAAFAKLTARGHAALLEPANARRLGTVLMYHIVPGRFLAAQLQNGHVLRTSQGTMTLKITKQGRSTWVYDSSTNGPATLQTVDIPCDNGIIHVIDNVLLPVVQRPAPAR